MVLVVLLDCGCYIGLTVMLVCKFVMCCLWCTYVLFVLLWFCYLAFVIMLLWLLFAIWLCFLIVLLFRYFIVVLVYCWLAIGWCGVYLLFTFAVICVYLLFCYVATCWLFALVWLLQINNVVYVDLRCLVFSLGFVCVGVVVFMLFLFVIFVRVGGICEMLACCCVLCLF